MRERLYAIEQLEKLRASSNNKPVLCYGSIHVFESVDQTKGFWYLYFDALESFIYGLLNLDDYHILVGEPM